MKLILRTALIILTMLACGLLDRPQPTTLEPDWSALEQQAQANSSEEGDKMK